MVRIYLDTSGTSLHKRGYRKKGGEAPLKETLASAIVLLSYWNKDKILIDPFCGSGTIPIEAALIAKNIAPGLYRDFDSEQWKIFKCDDWSNARKYCESVISLEKPERIIGSDIDPEAISMARENARNAKVADIIELSVKDFKDISCPAEKGVIICNPPYINDDENLQASVKDFEPHLALFGGTEGLDFYKQVLNQSLKVLNKPGLIGFEIGYDQKDKITKEIMKVYPNAKIKHFQDYANLDRMVFVFI